MRNRYTREIEGGEIQLMIEVAPGEYVNETYALKNHMIIDDDAKVAKTPKVRLDEWVD